jgi:cysteate synthase
VLSNRKPPYGIAGGLFDALMDCKGEMVQVSNEELEKAAQLFLHTEGIDLHPAAAVATASLMQYVEQKLLSPDAIIMLNITGGGEERLKKEKSVFPLIPGAIIDSDTTVEHLSVVLKSLMSAT